MNVSMINLKVELYAKVSPLFAANGCRFALSCCEVMPMLRQVHQEAVQCPYSYPEKGDDVQACTGGEHKLKNNSIF